MKNVLKMQSADLIVSRINFIQEQKALVDLEDSMGLIIDIRPLNLGILLNNY